MWEAVVFPIRPLKDSDKVRVWRTLSKSTVPKPVPGDTLGGASLRPSRRTEYWYIVAFADIRLHAIKATVVNLFIGFIELAGSCVLLYLLHEVILV